MKLFEIGVVVAGEIFDSLVGGLLGAVIFGFLMIVLSIYVYGHYKVVGFKCIGGKILHERRYA